MSSDIPPFFCFWVKNKLKKWTMNMSNILLLCHSNDFLLSSNVTSGNISGEIRGFFFHFTLQSRMQFFSSWLPVFSDSSSFHHFGRFHLVQIFQRPAGLNPSRLYQCPSDSQPASGHVWGVVMCHWSKEVKQEGKTVRGDWNGTLKHIFHTFIETVYNQAHLHFNPKLLSSFHC